MTLSPDGTRAAFIRDWNLWMRDVATGRETQLTRDGVKDFGYATDNAGWSSSDRAILVWSPDSKKIATFQQDQRNVGEMYLVGTQVGHPELRAWKYPLPGDSVVPMIHRVIIDVSTETPRTFGSRCPPTSIARRSAITSLAAAAIGPTSSGTRTARISRSCRRRATTSTRCSASPTPRPARFATCSRRRRHAVRVGQRASQLARAAGVERSDLVLGARQLGSALPLRSHHWKAQAADHEGRGQRHPAPAHR